MSTVKSFRKEEIAGKSVIDSSGKVAGKVKDLNFTLDSVITLVIEKTDGSEVTIPLKSVMGVSDHVIVKEDAFIIKPAVAAGMVACKSCGTLAKIGTTWCPSCGRALG
jgi:sporulation protein YlmC with PRC-barrel domain